jgi:hypothetical protein
MSIKIFSNHGFSRLRRIRTDYPLKSAASVLIRGFRLSFICYISMASITPTQCSSLKRPAANSVISSKT